MSQDSLEGSVASKKPNDIYMNADTVDQLNTNQQSNMTLCSGSTITQSYFLIKTNSIGDVEAGDKDA